MPNISKGLTQAYQIQDIAHDALQALRTSMVKEGEPLKVTKDVVEMISKLTKVWKDAQERISFHRRVPSPGRLGLTALKVPKRKSKVAPAPTLASLSKAPDSAQL